MENRSINYVNNLYFVVMIWCIILMERGEDL